MQNKHFLAVFVSIQILTRGGMSEQKPSSDVLQVLETRKWLSRTCFSFSLFSKKGFQNVMNIFSSSFPPSLLWSHFHTDLRTSNLIRAINYDKEGTYFQLCDFQGSFTPKTWSSIQAWIPLVRFPNPLASWQLGNPIYQLSSPWLKLMNCRKEWCKLHWLHFFKFLRYAFLKMCPQMDCFGRYA